MSSVLFSVSPFGQHLGQCHLDMLAAQWPPLCIVSTSSQVVRDKGRDCISHLNFFYLHYLLDRPFESPAQDDREHSRYCYVVITIYFHVYVERLCDGLYGMDVSQGLWSLALFVFLGRHGMAGWGLSLSVKYVYFQTHP